MKNLSILVFKQGQSISLRARVLSIIINGVTALLHVEKVPSKRFLENTGRFHQNQVTSFARNTESLKEQFRFNNFQLLTGLHLRTN